MSCDFILLQEEEEFLNFTRDQFVEAMVTIGATGSKEEVTFTLTFTNITRTIFCPALDVCSYMYVVTHMCNLFVIRWLIIAIF